MINHIITHRYQKKLRILATPYCSNNCYYCHNEGQEKTDRLDFDYLTLDKYLPVFRKLFQKVTITGGEPLECINIAKIVDVLYDHGFEINIDTSGGNLSLESSMLQKFTSIHITFKLGILEETKDDSNFIEKILIIKEIIRRHPQLKITINIPFINHELPKKEIIELFNSITNYNIHLKFLPIQNFNLIETSPNLWEDRWDELLKFINQYGFKEISADFREIEFENPDGIIVEFCDIACAQVDSHYAAGRCFDNMDFIINNELCMKLCRWQKKSIPLKIYEPDKLNIDSIINSLIDSNIENCKFNIDDPQIKKFDDSLTKFVFLKHLSWPSLETENKKNIYSLINIDEISYAGKNNIVSQLEKELCIFNNVDYCLSTSSGTAALYLAYLVLDFNKNSEIIVPIYSYPGTVMPLVQLGSKIKFCDVDQNTGNIDLDKLELIINEKTKGIVITHMWGNPVDMPRLKAMCEKKDIKIVEDCSHAIGAEINGIKVGTFGDIGCFSLQANKSVYAGEGGFIITNNKNFYEKAIMLSTMRESILDSVVNNNLRKYHETGLFLKLKIHPIGAAYALASLKNLPDVIRSRKIRFDILKNYLVNNKLISFSNEYAPFVNRTYYTIKPIINSKYINVRDDLLQRLIKNGLEVKIPDNKPFNHYTIYSKIFKSDLSLNEFEGANKYYKRIISFPSFTYEPIKLIQFYAYITNKESIEVIEKQSKYSAITS